jgi:branched-chain amino acid transport system ATP-binding protein
MSLLSVSRLTKSFGGLTAVSNLTFDVPSSAIVGLIGPNGAGKTTVFNLITGIYRPDQGEILFDGSSIVGLLTHRIVVRGIARTFQTIRLFQNLSALENVLAGCHCQMKTGLIGSLLHTGRQRREEREGIATALKYLEYVGLEGQAEQLARNLAYGSQRLLEIARALATAPKLLILDEPAGGMNEQETARLVELIRSIRDRGITILLIEHDMSLVMRVCEKIVVMEYGLKIAEGGPEEIKINPKVVEAYLGTEHDW